MGMNILRSVGYILMALLALTACKGKKKVVINERAVAHTEAFSELSGRDSSGIIAWNDLYLTSDSLGIELEADSIVTADGTTIHRPRKKVYVKKPALQSSAGLEEQMVVSFESTDSLATRSDREQSKDSATEVSSGAGLGIASVVCFAIAILLLMYISRRFK